MTPPPDDASARIVAGYALLAEFPDGTVDSSHVFEPPASNRDGIRALTKLEALRALYTQLGAATSVEIEWVSRVDAIASGLITGS